MYQMRNSLYHFQALKLELVTIKKNPNIFSLPTLRWKLFFKVCKTWKFLGRRSAKTEEKNIVRAFLRSMIYAVG